MPKGARNKCWCCGAVIPRGQGVIVHRAGGWCHWDIGESMKYCNRCSQRAKKSK